MKKGRRGILVRSLRALALSLLLVCSAAAAAAQNWPSFRGEFARGIADDQNLPVTWDIVSGEKILWVTPIPGMGHSSPVIWQDHLFLTTAVADEIPTLVLGDAGGISEAEDVAVYSWRLYCLDKASGQVRWFRQSYRGTPRASRHVKSSQANPTPVTDGRFVAAVFGSEGLAVFDFAGDLRWQHDLGILDPGLFADPTSQWGYASSPLIWESLLIVQVDRHSDSFVAAFDLETGDEIWKVERDEKPVWATPTLHRTPQRTDLVVVGGDYDRGLDPRTGRELWRFARDYEVKTTTPVLAGDLVILSGGFRVRPLFALRSGISGDVSLASDQTSSDAVAWVSGPGGPYTSTPIVYGDTIYFVRNIGILTALDLGSGELLFQHRLGGNFSASPVASDNKIYFTSEEGIVTVIEAAREPQILARNDMGEPCMGTPAISENALFIRTRSRLYAVGERSESTPRGSPR